MPTDATGTATTNFGFPTINPAVDAPSGLGENSIISDVDTKLAASTTLLGAVARSIIRKDGTLVGTRRAINFIQGTNVSLTVADNAGTEAVDVTINATGATTYRKNTTTDVVNTTVETDLLGDSITLAALSATSFVKVRMLCDFLNNTAAPVTGIGLVFKIKLGATTLLATPDLQGVRGAVREPTYFDFTIANLNVTNSQLLTGALTMGTNSSNGATTGFIAPTSFNVGYSDLVFSGTSAEDTSSSKTLKVTAQWGQANANMSMRCLSAIVEVV